MWFQTPDSARLVPECEFIHRLRLSEFIRSHPVTRAQALPSMGLHRQHLLSAASSRIPVPVARSFDLH